MRDVGEWPLGMPQRRAALRGAATSRSPATAQSPDSASTKGCSQRSSDVRGARVPAQPHSASTKGCSQRSSDLVAGLLELHVDDGLNEGLLSEEQRPHSRPTTHSTRPAASTKGCSQRSSDASIVCAIVTVLMPQRRAALRGVATLLVFNADADPDGLNEGLLSEEQRPSHPRREVTEQDA